MSLLNNIFATALEPSYATAAARKAEEGEGDYAGRHGRRFSVLTLVTVLAIVLLSATAASQLRRSSDVISAEREGLLTRINEYDDAADTLEKEASALEQEIVKLQAGQLVGADASQELRQSLLRLQAASGTVDVKGPGTRIVVQNAPKDGVGQDDTGDASQVLDIDLQRVVNGLWAAGAEAISINGERLTALSAIRSANDVITVNYRPLNPPYEILAIGDSDTLAARFAEGSGGEWLRVIHSQYGIPFEIRIEDNLTLPGHTVGTLRHVDLGDSE